MTRDAPVVAPLVTLAAMALEQQATHLHHPVDVLGIVGWWPTIARLPPRAGADAGLAIGRQLGEQKLDTRDDFFFGKKSSACTWLLGLLPVICLTFS